MNQSLQGTDFALVLEAQTEVAAALGDAFAATCDTDFLETAARARGLTVTRRGPGWPDLEWDISGPIGGRERDMNVAVLHVAEPVLLVVASHLGAIAARSEMQFFETSRKRTRVRLRVGIAGTSVAGRLLVQSMRLSRPRLERKLTRGLNRLSRLIARRVREARG